MPCLMLSRVGNAFSKLSQALHVNLAPRDYPNNIHHQNIETVPDWSCGYISRTMSPSLHGRRFPKSAHYSLEFEYSQPLGWISRTAEGKFVVGSKDEGRFTCITPTNNFILSNHDNSQRNKQSSYHWDQPSPYSISQQSPFRSGNIRFSPSQQANKYMFRTSSPGPLAAGPFVLEDLSSVNPSSAERSFPSTVSSHFASTIAQPIPPRELPSYQMVNTPHVHMMRGQFQPIHKYKAQSDIPFPLMKAMPQTPHHRHILNEDHHSQFPRTSLADKRLQTNGERYSQSLPWTDGVSVPSENPALNFPSVFPCSPLKQVLEQPKEQKPLATSSPPQPERRKSHILPSQVNDKAESNGISNYPMTYTRERLLGAVERVRRGSVHRNEPFTLPKTIVLPQKSTAISSLPSSSAQMPFRPLVQSPNKTPAFIHDIEKVNTSPSCRISITSSSSGQGSSVQDSKPTSLSHSHQDSLQGEFDLSAMNHSNGSSGFASRNISNVNTSLSQRYGMVPVERHPPSDFVNAILDSPQSEPSLSYHSVIDASSSDILEFKSPQQSKSSIYKLPRGTRPLSDYQAQLVKSDRGVSDSEIDTNLYPHLKKYSKYDNTEARCAALKEEFLKFRQRQKERRKSEEQESSC